MIRGGLAQPHPLSIPPLFLPRCTPYTVPSCQVTVAGPDYCTLALSGCCALISELSAKHLCPDYIPFDPPAWCTRDVTQ